MICCLLILEIHIDYREGYIDVYIYIYIYIIIYNSFFDTRFLSPTDQNCVDSSTYWQFFFYRPPEISIHSGKDHKNMMPRTLDIYIYIYIYKYFGWAIIEEMSIRRRVRTIVISWGQKTRVTLLCWFKVRIWILVCNNMYRYELHFGSFYAIQHF